MIVKELPFDIGSPIFELNWVMSSSALNEYIYKNADDQYFHVEGVYQHTSGIMQEYRDDPNLHHLALVIPIKDKESLVSYLKGEGPRNILYDKNGECFLLKLDADNYLTSDGRRLYTMHYVENDKEVDRKKEKEIKDFNIMEIKKCKTKNLPSLVNPFTYDGGVYEHRGDLSFIFNDEEDKVAIDNFIK